MRSDSATVGFASPIRTGEDDDATAKISPRQPGMRREKTRSAHAPRSGDLPRFRAVETRAAAQLWFAFLPADRTPAGSRLRQQLGPLTGAGHPPSAAIKNVTAPGAIHDPACPLVFASAICCGGDNHLAPRIFGRRFMELPPTAAARISEIGLFL